VANGADAVYFGLPLFNARMRADNFREDDLPELVKFLHANGCKAFVALNVLIFPNELEQAVNYLRLLARAGADAVILQDVGLARLAGILAPSLAVHASTQMSITSPEGVRFAASLGAKRVVLARELSLRELAKFDTGLPLEVFVHGALCVAYSGQCLTSESLGQRSANRGECAQACRMPYGLVVDGVLRDLGDKRYLLSPKDLAAVDEIPELIRLGISSFKIEGRLKSPEYVAAVTQVYRKAIDAATGRDADAPGPADRYGLEMTFSRGLFSGWMHGVNHQALVGATFGKKRGVFLGKVGRVFRDGFTLDFSSENPPLKPGDGIAFENPADTNNEQGGHVIDISREGNSARVQTHRGRIDYSRVTPGTRVWKTSDPALERALRASFAGQPRGHPDGKRALDPVFSGRAGEPLVVEAGGVRVESGLALGEAHRAPLTPEIVTEIFSRLGGTAFSLGTLQWKVDGRVFLPKSELGKMKSGLLDALEKLEAGLREPPSVTLGEAMQIIGAALPSGPPVTAPVLHVLVRTDGQLDAAVEARPRRIYVDFEDIRRYSGAVGAARRSGVEIFVATPRIQKAGEAGFFKLIEKCAPDGVLVRNPGAIEYFRASGLRMAGDFSLNIANAASVAVFTGLGLESLTVSYDLDIAQVLALAGTCDPARLELALHQHMPMFHMEHCAFAAFMSEGRTFLDCGRPCEKHSVHLRDRVGIEHPLRADVGCRNTLFNATAQSGATYYPDLLRAGFRTFRIELLEEDPSRSHEILATYGGLLRGELTAPTLLEKVRADSRLGVTEGTLRQS